MSVSKEYPTGWSAVADFLEKVGVDMVFGLPSDDMDLLAALETTAIRVVLCRDQRNAVFMSTGYALTSGRLSVCVVGKGPALTNTATGLLEARSGGAPVIVIASGTATAKRGTGAFQELDQGAVVGSLVKWAYRVEHPDRLCGALEKAAFIAVNGAPGPVYLELPEDVASAPVPGRRRWRPPVAHRVSPDPQVLGSVLARLRSAHRPLMLVGGGARWRNEDRAVERLAETLGAGVFATASGRGVVDEEHPLFCGLSGLYAVPPAADLWQRADLIVALGTRLEETATFGWDRLPAETEVVQVNLDATDVAVEWPGPLVLGDVGATVAAVLRAAEQEPFTGNPEWAAEVRRARDATMQAARQRREEMASRPGVHVAEVLAALADVVPPDCILVQENGLQDMWSYFYPYWSCGSTGGSVVPSEQTSLGFGAAAAVGVALASGGRPVVALVGDGAFNLFRSDFSTAVEAGAPVLYVVLDNGGYGWLQYQLRQRTDGQTRFRFTSDRTIAADPTAIHVSTRDELVPALRRAWAACAAGHPSVVTVHVDLDDVPPGLAQLAGDFPNMAVTAS